MVKLTLKKKSSKKRSGLGPIIGLIIAILILVLLAKLAMAAFWIALVVFLIIGGVYLVNWMKDQNKENIS